jgi:mycoredoxin
MENTIIIYGTTWCPDCVRAKNVFSKKGIEYTWINISDDMEARAYVEKVNQGSRSVPTIIFEDGDILVEPSNAELKNKLEQLISLSK